jgi:formylglycine-generating enzyme required for sulfatase activity/dienelactone hydrolase
MATVYLANDPKHRRQVAIKVLRPELSASLGAERFLREIETVGALTHPHILPLFDSGEVGGLLYFVMPFIEGETLRDRLDREGQLEVGEALRIAREVADGLDYAHGQGVVHRDIKPENVLLADEHAVIADFGVARVVATVGADRLTETGLAIGTPAYMSPEQVSGEQVIDGRSDVYSLGCLLYEMLSGLPPFTGPTRQSVIFQHVTADPPAVTDGRREIPAEVSEALRKALEKDPNDRFSTASEFAAAFIEPPSLGALSSRVFRKLKQPRIALATTIVVGLIAATAVWQYNRAQKVRWAREEAVPEIVRLIDEMQYPAAFALAKEAELYIPTDPMLTMLWPDMSRLVSLHTDPAGADVYVSDYTAEHGDWIFLGVTPIDSASVPIGFFRWRIESNGLNGIEIASDGLTLNLADADGVIRLLDNSVVPPGMVWVRGGDIGINTPRLRHLDPVAVDSYWIDMHEVTNREFKAFLDGGGYRNPDYWRHEFRREGRVMSWEEAMGGFVDATGRPGPAYWELGDYPDGQDEYPVTGVSWYEAAAYLESVGKHLPTVYHWNHAAGIEATEFIVAASNFSLSGPAAVGSYQSLGPYGTYDMAGNVKEWCLNASEENRYVMGGAWNEPSWLFNEADTRSPFERSPFFGFRGMKHAGSGEVSSDAADPIVLPLEEYVQAEEILDEIYQVYADLYSYDKTELNAVVEAVDDSKDDWRSEKISFDAAYGGERMSAYLFLPRNSEPPYQVVIYFPGSSKIYERSSDDLYPFDTDFIIVAGRAALFPIYKGTYERGDALKGPFPDMTSFYRDHMIMWAKDLGRSIDYLETRSDIDATRISFLGNSWGGAIGPILTAVEPRIKVSILENGGFFAQRALPAADQATFVPRVTVPVLMLSGRRDHVFPVESSKAPMFRLFGTPEADKRHVVWETGHELPRLEKMREVLDWLDRYLGPVN